MNTGSALDILLVWIVLIAMLSASMASTLNLHVGIAIAVTGYASLLYGYLVGKARGVTKERGKA